MTAKRLLDSLPEQELDALHPESVCERGQIVHREYERLFGPL